MAPASSTPNPKRWLNSRPTPFICHRNRYFPSNNEFLFDVSTVKCCRSLQLKDAFSLCPLNRVKLLILLLCATILGMMSFTYRTSIYFLISASPQLPKTESSTNASSDQNLNSSKLILFWTTFFESKDFYFGLGHEPFVHHKCPVSNCETTSNRNLVNSSDAVVFHIRNLDNHFPYHNPQQRWIFMLMESPVNTFSNLHNLDGVFNWTMTYRLDSDILQTYGVFSEMPAEQQTVTSKHLDEGYAKGRTKMVAWLVSHCESSSRREALVMELEKYIQVDVFGKCGKPCNEICVRKINEDYKFFLAFENSLCKDYVSEKFFRMAEDRMGIPVVYGGANYSKIAPPKSFIDASSFTTPKALAEYLLTVAGNETLYNDYHKWKGHYGLKYRSGFCELCKMVNEDLPPKTYNDMNLWWIQLGNCKEGLHYGHNGGYKSKHNQSQSASGALHNR